VGNSFSRPIQVLRQNDSVAEQITFQGAGPSHGAATEVGEFYRGPLDPQYPSGFRYGNAPIESIDWSQGGSRASSWRSILALAGWKDCDSCWRRRRLWPYPLLAADFVDNPTRVISFFDPSGTMVGEPVLLQNTYLQSDTGSASQTFVTNPTDQSAHLHVEFRSRTGAAANVSLKVSYLDSHDPKSLCSRSTPQHNR